jgi:hypothetical protein
VALIGIVITVFVLTALAASLSLPLTAMWLRLTVCVTGSWSAAVGLLLVGWSIHQAMVVQLPLPGTYRSPQPRARDDGEIGSPRWPTETRPG